MPVDVPAGIVAEVGEQGMDAFLGRGVAIIKLDPIILLGNRIVVADLHGPQALLALQPHRNIIHDVENDSD